MNLVRLQSKGNGGSSDIKPFIVNFSCADGYKGQNITMKYKGTPHQGEVVSDVSGIVNTNGELTLYPMHDGEWEIEGYSVSVGLQKQPITLEKWGNYSVEFYDKPNGKNVTPVNDIQIWLNCANIWDLSYTTIDEVLADTTTFNILVSDDNASDYLVRSTSFATKISSNKNYLDIIGVYDYCSELLLNNDDWLNAIFTGNKWKDSTLFNIKVPTMSSDNGKVVSTNADTGTYLPYKAFDGNTSTAAGWKSVSDPHTCSVGYDFEEPTYIKAFYMYNNMGARTPSFLIQGSDDNDTYETLLTVAGAGNETTRMIPAVNKAYRYYKYTLDVTTNGTGGSVLNELQFYGRKAHL